MCIDLWHFVKDCRENMQKKGRNKGITYMHNDCILLSEEQCLFIDHRTTMCTSTALQPSLSSARSLADVILELSIFRGYQLK